MKLRELLVLFVLVFLVSCGSKRQIAKSSSKKNKVENKGQAKVTVITEKEENKVDKEVVFTKEEKKTINKVEESSKTVSVIGDVTQQYIDKYADIAIVEMLRYKIPASITLAQGVLESGNGRSPLALKSNNHFGIKCHKGWKGNSVSHDDDAIGECFRKYTHPETSYEDHSKFLTSRSRYSKLFKLKPTDYVGWAHGLKKAGYATDPKYPRKLIAIINKYQLHKYDLIEEETDKATNNNNTEEYVSSHKPSVVAHITVKGDTLYSLSRKYNTTVEKIKEINGLSDNTISIGQELLMP